MSGGATFRGRFARDRNPALPPLSPDRGSSVLRGPGGLDYEEFETLGCSIAEAAAPRDSRLA